MVQINRAHEIPRLVTVCDIEVGLDTVLDYFEGMAFRVRVIVLMTDGAFDVEDTR